MMEEREKPFKTIEVTDRCTGTVCKVACMSCIRGHRTTACGAAVCRQKLFWTVKRPGRPSNSCTCRFGSSGHCQCVVAKSACPHKPKKGEKRTVNCRCDEQGRWCCVLKAPHWGALSALQKPRVDFFPTPEALDQARLDERLVPTPTQPSLSSVSTPRPAFSMPPTSAARMPSKPMVVEQGHSTSQVVPQVPRSGVMGVQALWEADGDVAQNALKWEGMSPQAPSEYHPRNDFVVPFPDQMAQLQPDSTSLIPAGSQYQNFNFVPMAQSVHSLNVQPPNAPPVPLSAFSPSLANFQAAYTTYQSPSAICQNCGLNGCTCKNCPTLMQNTETGSWAQCCSRKHTFPVTQACCAPQISHDVSPIPIAASGLRPGGDMPLSPGFDLDNADVMDFSQFLEGDLEPPSTTHGCCGEDRGEFPRTREWAR